MRNRLLLLTFIILFSFQAHLCAAENNKINVIYSLEKKIASCRKNCKDLGALDCVESTGRTIISKQINDAKIIIIEGRSCTHGQTCNNDGRFDAIFRDDEGNKYENHVNIECRSCENIDMKFDLKKGSSGTLKLYLKTSDWCTSLEELTVFQK